jgi:putative CocE/NonD family hydrolase
MKAITELPRPIKSIENFWIPMSDGTRLAARMWLPADADQNPVPAILEYIPYRKNDFTALKDSTRHAYIAGHGYACLRVDMRGAGDSDGILYDEYLKQEQDDALEVIAWIAARPWCTGSVGMIGISWGGFNSLQVAARRPPALKAIISVASTDDRYADDVHYSGGCVLASDMLPWGSVMLAYNARPPDPRHVGERWREMWLERLEKTPPFVEAWLAHQRRDEFWKQGSVGENYADITAAVFAVNGWADGYTNTVLRLLAGLPGPRKGLIGPWAHSYPFMGRPGPNIGFLQECLRWWDHWLKGIDTGVMDEPMLRAWVQASAPPSSLANDRPGRWVAEPAWPSPNIRPRRYALNPGVLDAAAAPEAALEYTGRQTHGLDAGLWWTTGSNGELPGDQRFEDGSSLCFTSAPLAEGMDVLGFPEVRLTVAADQPNALLAVRLCDVAPNGESQLISRGLLNLTHRDSHEFPEPLEPGRRYTVTVRLKACGHSLPAGHRWRVGISPAYWPWAWPSPQPVMLTVFAGEGSYLELPERPRRDEDDSLPAFQEPEAAPMTPHEVLVAPTFNRAVRRDLSTNRVEVVDTAAGGFRLAGNGIEWQFASRTTFSIVEGDPLSATVRCEWTIAVGRGAWQTRAETNSLMSADAESFRVSNSVQAYEGNTRVFSKSSNFTTRRDLV